MRFWLSLTTFVVGLSLAAVGLVDQFENQPLEQIRITKELTNETNFVLIPNRTLTSYPGTVQVSATGEGQVFIATVRESDATAWLTDTQHQELRLSVDVANESAEFSSIERAGSGNLVDPVGFDVWRSSEIYEGTGKITVPPGNEVSVLIASNGLEPAPNQITVVWTLPEQPLPFSPLPPIGLALMLLGSIGVVLTALVRNKKSRAGRNFRGPKPPRRRKVRTVVTTNPKLSERRAARGMSLIAATLAIGSLSGCAVEYQNPIIAPSPSQAPDTLTPVMTRDQLERVLDEILTVIEEADADLDRESIEARVTGPALAVRRAAYNLARRTEAEDGPVPIQRAPIKLFLPSATDAWPRSVVVVTGDELLQLLVLHQEGPRENYRLIHYSALLPGTSFPEVAAEEVGANKVKPDSKFLAFDPLLLPQAVGELINSPEDNPWGGLIDSENKYITDLIGVQANLVETLDNANLDFGHRLGDEQLTLLATADGGALVALYMIDTYTIIPKEPGDAVAITGDEALLLGTGGSATGIETRYGAMLLFHVPAVGSESRVTLIGATQQLLTAVSLGAR